MTFASVLQILVFVGIGLVVALVLTAIYAFATEPQLGDLGKEKKPKK